MGSSVLRPPGCTPSNMSTHGTGGSICVGHIFRWPSKPNVPRAVHPPLSLVAFPVWHEGSLEYVETICTGNRVTARVMCGASIHGRNVWTAPVLSVASIRACDVWRFVWCLNLCVPQQFLWCLNSRASRRRMWYEPKTPVMWVGKALCIRTPEQTNINTCPPRPTPRPHRPLPTRHPASCHWRPHAGLHARGGISAVRVPTPLSLSRSLSFSLSISLSLSARTPGKC